jgi:predicted phage terminase large subunit-like protein
MGPSTRFAWIQTLWHEKEPLLQVLANEGTKDNGGVWRVIRIPALADENDPLGRQPGEGMISARGDRDWHGIRKKVGEFVFAALYQQRPSPAEGGLFKRAWWRFWSPAGEQRIHLGGRIADLRDCWRFATVDLAASRRTSADWTVIAAWARTPAGDLVLLDRTRVRVGEDQHFAQARPLIERWQLDTLFVEKSQHGFTLVREATQNGLPITPLTAETDKVTRALPASAWCSGGRVWLPAGASWLDVWTSEAASFPNGSHDDQVDALAYAVRAAVTQWVPLVNRAVTATVQRQADRMPDPWGGQPEVDFDRAGI